VITESRVVAEAGEALAALAEPKRDEARLGASTLCAPSRRSEPCAADAEPASGISRWTLRRPRFCGGSGWSRANAAVADGRTWNGLIGPEPTLHYCRQSAMRPEVATLSVTLEDSRVERGRTA
jgi:hypothetical protein